MSSLSFTHIHNGPVPYLSDEKLRPVVTTSMKSFILKAATFQFYCHEENWKKKPKYFSPSLTWKLLWRHLISKCKCSPASCWNMEGGKNYSYKCFVWVPSTILRTILNFYCTKCLWQVWSALFPEVHLSRQRLQQTLWLRFVTRRKTRNNIGIAPARRPSERWSTKSYPPACVWE